MDRIQQGQPGTLTATWERDGDPVDPGIVHVTVTRDDGTILVANQATVGSGPDRTFALTPAQTSTLDWLTAVWTAPDGSTLKTFAEIVGGFLFSVQRARHRSPLQDEAAYPTEAILYYRTLAEMALEDICGVSFVPRYNHDIARITAWGLLTVSRRKVTSVRNVWTATDTGPQALPTLIGLRIMNGGVIFMPMLFNWWVMPITVSYENGYPQAPPRVGRAALELARRWLVESPWDERMVGYRDRQGGELQILTASHGDPFDIPEVVAVADQYGTPSIM